MSGWQSLALLVVFVLGYLVSWMQWYQPEREKAQLLSEELVRKKAKVEGLMSELPQQNLSYWKFEGPKLQARVLELEMQLEQLRSQTLWKD
jgi:hypothetical protein